MESALRDAIACAVLNNKRKLDNLIEYFTSCELTTVAELLEHVRYHKRDPAIKAWLEALVGQQTIAQNAARTYEVHLNTLLDNLAKANNKRKGTESASPHEGNGTPTQQHKKSRSHFPLSALQTLNPNHALYWEAFARCAVLAFCASTTDTHNCVLCGNSLATSSTYNFRSHLMSKTACTGKVDGAHIDIISTPPTPLAMIAAIPQSALDELRLLSSADRRDLLATHLPGDPLEPVRAALRTAFAGLPVPVPVPLPAAAASAQQLQLQPQQPPAPFAIDPALLQLPADILAATTTNSIANFHAEHGQNEAR